MDQSDEPSQAYVDLIAVCLSAADEYGASDIFLKEGEIPRFKIEGRMMVLGERPITLGDMAGFWHACGADPEQARDYDTGIFSSSGTRFRVNLHHTMGRLGCVMRRVKNQIPALEELGLPVSFLENWVQKRAGLILITGPTGSGKSTTLASMIEWLNQYHSRHIVTIEDPIEYLFENKQSLFTQREVGRDTDNFANGLRGSLRQAPDVILVGEIRDAATALTALQAAETGHLVLSTLHNERVSEAMERLLGFFPEQQSLGPLNLLSVLLVGIICQKLVPNTAGGSTLLVERMENIGSSREFIKTRAWDKLQDFIESGQNPNNESFLTSILKHFKNGDIDEATAIAACGNENAFRRAARGIS